jgi:hypothetical protein
MALHLVLALVVSHGDGAVGALERLSAGTAESDGGVSAAVEQDHNLLFFREAFADFFC